MNVVTKNVFTKSVYTKSVIPICQKCSILHIRLGFRLTLARILAKSALYCTISIPLAHDLNTSDKVHCTHHRVLAVRVASWGERQGGKTLCA